MNRLSYLLAMILFLLSASVSADVWKVDPLRNWDPFWEAKYSEWFASNKVGPRFFKDKGEPWSELRLDCADASYAFRIYFAWQNRLPFNFFNGWAYRSQAMKKFDHLREGDDRVAAFIDYLRDKVGTVSIAYHDAYPVKLKDLRPGDMFLYKRGEGKQSVKHAYIIKRIRVDGNIDVLFSTQYWAKEGKPLALRTRRTLYHKPTEKGWGFKRFRSNLHINNSKDKEIDQLEVPGASNEQYELAEKLDETDFFFEVEKRIRLVKADPKKRVGQLLQNLCGQMLERKEKVINAWEFVNYERDGRCLDYDDFDRLSTPSRDAGILKAYDRLRRTVQRYKASGESSKISPLHLEYVDAIFSPYASKESRDKLARYCGVKVVHDNRYAWINLGNYYKRAKDGMVSGHPNDNPFRRWGYDYGEKTYCNGFYTDDLQD